MQGRRSVPTFRVRPDFVFLKSRTAIFVDGCFWHGCPKHCKYAKWLPRNVTANNPASPKNRLRRTGRAFWRRKLAGNKTRDRLVNRALRRAGWRVVRIWECELRNAGRILKLISKALNRVKLRHAAGR
jgi:DNA mismatch endonuclease (patch repair protein)